MSEFDFNDLMKASEDAFKPCAEGDHVGEIIEAKATKSSTGKPMIKCKIRVVNGPDAGRNFYNNFTLSTDNVKAMAMFFMHMAALGLPKEFFAQNPSMETVAQALVGKHALFTIAHREWNNTKQENVTSIKAVQGFTPTSSGVPSPSSPSVPVPSPTAVPAPTPTPTPSGAPPLPI